MTETETSISLPEDVVVAIMKVLDYLIYDEALAYQNALWFERKLHIYPSLVCIERWLTEMRRRRRGL